jgi:streptomycin 6-kinase
MSHNVPRTWYDLGQHLLDDGRRSAYPGGNPRRPRRRLRYGRRVASTVPRIDPGARLRLTARFGGEVEAWFGELPKVLAALAERWRLEFGAAIPRGSVSTVFRCRLADGRPAVLKASPDRARLAFEAAALNAWHTVHTPAVLALDEQRGALLIEAIEPGTPLADPPVQPAVESVAELLTSLHGSGTPDPSFPAVGQRVAYLFDASARLYERHPRLTALVPPGRYEDGRRLATRLARHDSPTVLLHGDLTPSNILDGGPGRGLVAIDPAPCLGDAAFDAVDLVLWQAGDLATIEARGRRLALATGLDAARVLGWCTAFAAMNALELASQDGPRDRVQALLELASRA